MSSCGLGAVAWNRCTSSFALLVLLSSCLAGTLADGWDDDPELNPPSTADYECRGPDGSVQPCENFTFAGSLVEERTPPESRAEMLQLVEEVQTKVGTPKMVELAKCSKDFIEWGVKVTKAFHKKSEEDLQKLTEIQNQIMANHQEVARDCPVAWLLTLLLKVESNLMRGAAGLPCARVHAQGCFRDARGYLKLYADQRLELGASKYIMPDDMKKLGRGQLLASAMGMQAAVDSGGKMDLTMSHMMHTVKAKMLCKGLAAGEDRIVTAVARTWPLDVWPDGEAAKEL